MSGADLFDQKAARPMLIGAEGAAFDSSEFIFELKLDGERCLAYLDPERGTDLRNKRNLKMLPKIPELTDIHRQARSRCILDGELAIMDQGKPNFAEIQRRSLMDHLIKIRLAAQTKPACFIAFDIIYYENRVVTDLPLMERKKLLHQAVKEESARFAVSRVIENNGIAFYELAAKQNLEGIVAKRKDSQYYLDRRTKDWIKCKNLKDDDFVICGYIQKENHVISLILGQYSNDRLIYQGHVTLGVGGDSFQKIKELPRIESPAAQVPSGHENAVWVKPILCCTVQYMEKTASGGMRQPVLKALREDKLPSQCVEKRE